MRPQFCGIPPCLAHTHHTCPSKRPGQTLAYPRRLQKLNKSSPFDKVLSNAFLPSDPCHCPCLFFRSRIAEFSLLMDACQRQRIPPRLVLFFRFACRHKLAYPRQLALITVSEKLIAEGIQRSGTKKGPFPRKPNKGNHRSITCYRHYRHPRKRRSRPGVQTPLHAQRSQDDGS